VKNLFKVSRLLDFTSAFASLGYGLHTRSALWTGAGLLGLVLAWINIPVQLQQWLFSRRSRRHAQVTDQPR
jgi:hypothetical protein